MHADALLCMFNEFVYVRGLARRNNIVTRTQGRSRFSPSLCALVLLLLLLLVLLLVRCGGGAGTAVLCVAW